MYYKSFLFSPWAQINSVPFTVDFVRWLGRVAFCDAGNEEFSDTVMITKFMLEYIDEALLATLVLEEPYFYSGDV